jgi:hypothetical protein
LFYQTRTDEGFSLVEGVSNKFGNLFYSLKRNMNYLKERYAMCLMWSKRNIVIASFKSNGLVKTQLNTETIPTVENAEIEYDSLGNPLITSRIVNAELYATFEDVKNYLDAYNINRGFARIFDSRGRVWRVFMQKMNHEWSINKMTVKAEEKFNTSYLKLDFIDDKLYVDDALYALSGVTNWYRFTNDFLQLFDQKSRPLSNKYKYNLVLLNGVIYDEKIDLEMALLNLGI